MYQNPKLIYGPKNVHENAEQKIKAEINKNEGESYIKNLSKETGIPEEILEDSAAIIKGNTFQII